MQTALAPRASSRPFPLPADLPQDRLFPRLVLAHAVAAARGAGTNPSDVAREYWPTDRSTLDLVERGATTPATMADSAWAGPISPSPVGSFLAALGDRGAAALMARGGRFSLAGIHQLNLPRASATGAPQWIGEGAVAPVAQATIVTTALGPVKKLSLLEVITREISEASVEAGETSVGEILSNGLTRSLDLTIFGSGAGDAATPPGPLNGVTASAATAGGGLNALLSDLRTLGDSIAASGGSSDILFFASPGRTLAIRGYCPALASQVLASAFIGPGVLIAIDARSFTSAFSGLPTVRVSKETLLHMEDTTPLAIGTPGSPPVVAAPARSIFQSDCLAIRCDIDVAYVFRQPGCVAHIDTGLSW
jgi:hypothetical protein